MIKKKLKKWYPTKEREFNADILHRLQEAANNIHRTSITSHGDWVVVSPHVANHLNTLYPSLTTNEAANYTNTWCGTTFLTTSANTTFVASGSTNYFGSSFFS